MESLSLKCLGQIEEEQDKWEDDGGVTDTICQHGGGKQGCSDAGKLGHLYIVL